MTTLESKILKHKNINILKEKTDKVFNTWDLLEVCYE